MTLRFLHQTRGNWIIFSASGDTTAAAGIIANYMEQGYLLQPSKIKTTHFCSNMGIGRGK